MEGEIITKAGGLLTFGLLFIYLGLTGWRDRRKEQISLIEAAILKAGNGEPLPLNAWDRAMAYIQPVLMLIFGPCMVIIAIAILTTLGE